MKSISIITFFLLFSFFSIANSNKTLLANKPIDSTYFKNHGIYLSLSPLTVGSSINTDTKNHSFIFSSRVGVNWMTKKYRKFGVFGAFGTNINFFGTSLKTNEFGFTVGKLYKDKNSGFWDLNVGISYVGREARTTTQSGSFWDGTSSTSVKIDRAETFGIPFEATFYGSKFPFGAGIGIAGNLNVEQPYIGLSFRLRLGTPVLKTHSTSKRKNSSKI
jgi:hypothetical protein